MTQGATAWAAVVFPVWLGSRRWIPNFSCHRADEESITEGSVKALLPSRGDLFHVARVGSWHLAGPFLALTSCPKNEPVDQARAAYLTTADFPQITAGGNNDG